MTDKERLSMIKHDLEERGQYGGFLDDCDTEWLIEQAEKLERYEKALKEIAILEDDMGNDLRAKTVLDDEGVVIFEDNRK